MKLIDRALNEIQKGINTEYNCIPFGLPRFEEFLPGIEQSTYYLITANSGIGKSQITDCLFMYHPYEFMLANPGKIKLRIFYYSMEMDAVSKMLKCISRYLFKNYKISISVKELRSKNNKHRCPQELYDKIQEARKYFADMEEFITIRDGFINPYGIFKEMKSYALNNGKEYKKTAKFLNYDTQKWEENEVFDRYEPNDPNEYRIIITDQLNLLTNETSVMNPKGDQHGTITKYSSKDCVTLRNHYGFTIVNVQQQSAEKEKQQFTTGGKSIESKLEPSLDGLGDNKLTQRDANVVMGIYAPDRFELPDHRGYNIRKLGDNYRSLTLLKDRDGSSNARIGIWYDGKTNFIEELPKIEKPIKEEPKRYKV